MELRFYCLAMAILNVATTGTGALDCYTCTNASYVSECKSATTCNAGEICFSDHIQTTRGMLYSFGCRAEAKCNSVIQDGNSAGSGSIVGRSVSIGACSECCRNQHCNRQLCQHSFSEKQCSDGTEINCKSVGTVVNICSDTQHAKTVCERFCGLCDYADGAWSSWLTWSSCDVTCGNGTQTRIRKCTEPLPSGGGHDCAGKSQEVQSCTEDTCPVHGAWTSWDSWGSCSAMCGIGLQRRDRSCSAPYPGPHGSHCFGDSRDDQICLANACHDGGWSSWQAWGTCSRTCGDGIRSRSRLCDSPLPSIQGKYCQGNSFQVETCIMQSCPVTNGEWGSWSSWITCTASCDGGMQSRERHCNNPKPSLGGDFCDGSPIDVRMCNTQRCPRHRAAFLATSASRQTNGTVRFTSVQLNEGSVYSSSTGEFTCPFPGLYVFIANMIESGDDNNYIRCYIIKNGSSYVYMFSMQGKIDGKFATDGFGTATGAATLTMRKGDRVYVYCDSNTGTNLAYSSFSGFLVSAD